MTRKHLYVVPARTVPAIEYTLPSQEPPAIARRWRRARDLAGLSIGQTKRLSGLDVSRFESGQGAPTSAEASNLCELYEVSWEWVVGLVPEMVDPSELPEFKPGYGDDILTIVAKGRTRKDYGSFNTK